MNKISRIWQPHGVNLLTVVYKSGAVRYCEINGNYWPQYRMTKTQRAFLEAATATEYENLTEWRCEK